MTIKRFITVTVLLGTLCISRPLGAQMKDAVGTFSPYSLFGVGDLAVQGTILNRSMGGVGAGLRDNRYINYLNPAAVAADTLSFMFDMGLKQENRFSSDNKTKSLYNVCNLDHLVFAVPLYKTLAFSAGIAPYSNVGYSFQEIEERKDYIAELGEVAYLNYGSGSVNQAFASLGVSLFKHLALGAKGIYYFGSIDKFTNVSMMTNENYAPLVTDRLYFLRGYGAQLGMQAFTHWGKGMQAVVGASATLGTKLTGHCTRNGLAHYGNTIDTLYAVTENGTQYSLPKEFSVGLSLGQLNKWNLALDYEFADWSDQTMHDTPGVDFRPGKNQAFRIGMEYTPDKFNVRYFFKKITYRAGAYRTSSYIHINGEPVVGTGLTFGVSVPVFRYYNSIGFGVDLGQRGSVKGPGVRERYAMFVLDFSIHELWFIKQRYN